ncbi:hydroxyacylglutathione hydrolase [Modicisalibacter ilicicola DSM 19980]|uniref:Hydroxyacylglutathione hydrolase n=1 Tax=Modicisalibacter ilicicola DSM 19980 TaxID=1121942 RepID=A0A1M4YJQ1_9GAMM|nr:MBL fold metallo-hydrolase [Halomonas ilicicola]SHF06075.1 hydroxyacylglutathione hydrolase [Halomonas ilicicola DSM 19980]
MILEKIKSEGIAHLSYMVVDGNEAAVIDPRRDIEVYLDIARREGANITHVFETHRNEDYVVGSKALAQATGARVFHGQGGEVDHAEPVQEGQTFELGSARLSILETPGHTFDSISIVLADTAFSDEPVAVFTGDALFIGDVGRTDFYPDRREETAAKLYDSIFDKLLPLGDGVQLYPAHGAGSVCGSGMADREFSTLGYERRYNPMLQHGRDEFIKLKRDEHHYQPPYFRKMEELNSAAPERHALPHPKALAPGQFAKRCQDGLKVLDLRTPEAFCGAHIPGSLSMPADVAPAYIGWMVSYDDELGLVIDEPGDIDESLRALYRLGYDKVSAYLTPGMTAWEASGADYAVIPTISAARLLQRYERSEDFVLLDVRAIDEYEAGHLENATHIYLGHLPERLDELPRDKPIVTFCGSGKRAAVAASLLSQHGFENVENCLGSMSACKNLGCRIVR